MLKSKKIYIAFGANLHNPKVTFKSVIRELRKNNIEIIKFSNLWVSPAWPEGSDQPDYTNACAEIFYKGTDVSLLNILHTIEDKFGRKRRIKNESRSIDLDILDFHSKHVEYEQGLILPHPRMQNRAFVLLPLKEIASSWVDPVSRLSIDELIDKLSKTDFHNTISIGSLHSKSAYFTKLKIKPNNL